MWPGSSPMRIGALNTRRTITSTTVMNVSFGLRWAAPGCVGITPSPNRSGRASNENAYKAGCSLHAPTPAGRYSDGSTGTTRAGFTVRSIASRRSSGNSSTLKRHNQLSGRRGDAQCAHEPGLAAAVQDVSELFLADVEPDPHVHTAPRPVEATGTDEAYRRRGLPKP